jgi:two-component system, cell cycle sensor histidine kinase and response regulator CckA
MTPTWFGGEGMAQATDKKDKEEIVGLHGDVRRLTKKLSRQKVLEIRLNETLQNLQVHQEELRTRNDDLISAQREITNSQRKYIDLFDFAPIGYFLVDPKGLILEINLKGASMIGRHRDAIGGKPFFRFIAMGFRQAFDSHLRELWAGRPASVEVALLQDDGGLLPVELFGIPVADDTGRVTQARIAATDISRRRRAEEALRESERQMDAIIKNIPDIVYRLDQNGRINFISASIQRYGYTPNKLLGRPMLNLVHPRDRSRAGHRVNERRTGARSTNGLELCLMLDDERGSASGKEEKPDRVFLVTAEGLYAGQEQAARRFIGTQGIAHDITKRKQIEMDRLKLEAELQKASKMEAIGRLAGGIAHDFNNLLMGIQGSVSLMNLDADDPDKDQFLQRLENIEQCVQRGRDLTQQLLGFAKGGKYNVTTVDLNRIVGDTAQLFERTHKSIECHYRLAPALWAVDADKGQLEQVLLNLLINADQAMPGGGRISLETGNVASDAPQLEGLGLSPRRYVRILIRDTGIGMTPAIQGRIFEPFFTTKEIGRGTGLGLASAYGIIKNHGGVIDVHSAPGKGSRFFVFLPASSASVAPDLDPAHGIIAGRGTILLIDDEKIIVDVSSKLLQRLGYRVIVAEDGNAAEAIYRQRYREIDMVILDMIMPLVSGHETYNRLKKINPGIKVLLSSGYSKDGQTGDILVRDGQDFVQKPFDLTQLSHKIAGILAKS